MTAVPGSILGSPFVVTSFLNQNYKISLINNDDATKSPVKFYDRFLFNFSNVPKFPPTTGRAHFREREEIT